MSLYEDLKREGSRSLSVEAQNKPPLASDKYPIKFDKTKNGTLDDFFKKKIKRIFRGF